MTGFRDRVLLCSLAAFVAFGCQKKRGPSEHYERAHQLFTKLYAAQLDDAFADPQMAEVEKLLDQVPAESIDFRSAQELHGRITEGRARIQSRREEQRNSLNQALGAQTYQRFSDERSQDKTPLASPDAGAAHPVLGMSLAEFSQRFGGCFRSGAPILVTGQGTMDSWELKDIANCRDRHPGFDAMVVLTNDKQVAMTVQKRQVNWNSPDAGTPAQPGQGASAR